MIFKFITITCITLNKTRFVYCIINRFVSYKNNSIRIFYNDRMGYYTHNCNGQEQHLINSDLYEIMVVVKIMF